MPLYEYQCPKCGRFELIRKFSDPPLLTCPTCGSEVQKLLSAPAIQFKGAGWYITDYARKGAPSEGGSKDSGGKDSGGKESSGKESSGGGGSDGGGKDSGSKESGGKDSGGKESGSKSDSSDSASKKTTTKTNPA